MEGSLIYMKIYIFFTWILKRGVNEFKLVEASLILFKKRKYAFGLKIETD